MDIELIKEKLGFHLEMKATFVDDDEERPEPRVGEHGEDIHVMQDTATVTYSFGVNNFPTKEEIEKALSGVQSQVRKQLGKPNLRLTTDRDFGFCGMENYKIKD